MVFARPHGYTRHRAGPSYADSHLSGSLSDRPGGRREETPGPLTGFRLRCGDYRIFFDPRGEASIEITTVLHRRDAYR
ncbi:MAG: type II toxin-antitoxin system RelE/ParE family toxin [Bryobacteraceae bacterium]